MSERKDKIARMLEVSYLIVETLNADKEMQSKSLEQFGLGYMAVTHYLREGMKAVIEMQGELESTRANYEFAKMAREDAYKLLERVFGERDADTYTDKYVDAIKELVARLDKEAEESEEDEA